MLIKNPAHPGRLVKAALDDLNVPVTKAADALGVTRQALNNIISGRTGITPEMAVRLEAGIGSTAETWTEMQRAYDLAQMRERSADITARVRRLAPA